KDINSDFSEESFESFSEELYGLNVDGLNDNFDSDEFDYDKELENFDSDSENIVNLPTINKNEETDTRPKKETDFQSEKIEVQNEVKSEIIENLDDEINEFDNLFPGEDEEINQVDYEGERDDLQNEIENIYSDI
ncbi:hypothetical protein OAQ99_04195, partial [Candidatus Kapabacteria bacterium]|nr:hypothetical protein [Candidatus Kapabacteria bacterium]